MTVVQSLLAFVLAAGLLVITPGLDTALVLRTSAIEGPRRAGFAAIGIGISCLVWGVAVSVGLGALLAASEVAYTALKWIGAVYLVWLGIGLIRNPRTAFARDTTATKAPAHNRASGWLVKGMLTNILNPKVGVFYVTFLPQFVPAGVPVAGYTFLLASVHVALSVFWFALLIGASVPLGRALGRPAVVRAMDRLAGCVFVGFGAKLALSRQ